MYIRLLILESTMLYYKSDLLLISQQLVYKLARIDIGIGDAIAYISTFVNIATAYIQISTHLLKIATNHKMPIFFHLTCAPLTRFLIQQEHVSLVIRYSICLL